MIETTEEIHDKAFETLFEVRLYIEGDVAFITGESAFTLEPDEVVALMAIIRPHQVWDNSADLEQVILQDPWYRVFRKLKETEAYEQRSKK